MDTKNDPVCQLTCSLPHNISQEKSVKYKCGRQRQSRRTPQTLSSIFGPESAFAPICFHQVPIRLSLLVLCLSGFSGYFVFPLTHTIRENTACFPCANGLKSVSSTHSVSARDKSCLVIQQVCQCSTKSAKHCTPFFLSLVPR